MIYPYGSLKFPTPFSDTSVDDISGQDGRVDQFALIDLKLSDKKLIDNINERINESKAYYDDGAGFNLTQKRGENLRMYLGMQIDQSDFYDQEEPYVENQVRGAVESIVAYCSARSPQSTVVPANDTPEAKKFASNLETAHDSHSTEHDLRGLVEIAVRSWLLNQAAYLLLEFDPSYGDDGDIVPSIIPCDELVVDKNAKYGQDPDFIAIFEKQTVEDLLFNYPEKKQEILDHFNIKKRGKTNMTQEVVTKKTWFTYYASGERKQGMCVYFETLMLIKTGDLNWLKGKKNFLHAPMKPIIPLNVLNDGKHWVDFSNPLEDGIKMQKLLNVRGRQISLNADGANGTKVINAKASGLTKEDAENWVPGANKTVFLKRAKDGVPINQMVDILPAQGLPDFVVADKTDMRTQLGYVMGVPIDQTDSTSGDQDPTLGQALIKKNNMNARQDMIVRALDRFLYKYFNLLTQMMFVWYDDEHYFSYLDEDGSFERIVIKRYYFDDGMSVNVRGGSTIAFDKNREQAIATHLMDKNAISYLDGYRLLGLPNPQKLYDNWVKQTKSPQDLMRDGNQMVDDAEAYAEFLDILNGADPKPREDPSREYILTLRKLMISDKFLKAESKYRTAFDKRVKLYLDSYEQRMALDQLGQEDIAKIEPGKPVPEAPTPPPMPGMPGAMPMGGQPGMPPQGMGAPGMMAPPMGGAPGMMPPGPGMPPGVPGMPPMIGPGMPPPMPGAGGPGAFTGGGPIPNPANPQTPAGLGAVPGF